MRSSLLDRNHLEIESFPNVRSRVANLVLSVYGDSIEGIFFDESHNECGPNNEYAELYRFISENTKRKHPGAMTVINPGTSVPQCYENR